LTVLRADLEASVGILAAWMEDRCVRRSSGIGVKGTDRISFRHCSLIVVRELGSQPTQDADELVPIGPCLAHHKINNLA
jgi:hypothetical protein